MNARDKMRRGGMKGKGGVLPKENRKVPGFLGSDSVKTRPARTGYTQENRLGPGGKGRPITLPSD